MESIYEPDLYRSSEHIDLKQYFTTYSEICPLNHNTTSSEADNIQRELNNMNVFLDKNMLNELEKSCSIDNLHHGTENYMQQDLPKIVYTKSEIENVYPKVPEASSLQINQCKVALSEKMKKLNSDLKTMIFLNHSLNISAPINYIAAKSEYADIQPGSEAVYTIYAYKPAKVNREVKTWIDRIKLSCEIEALGRTTLTEIADVIFCAGSVGLYKEVENTDVDLSTLTNTKEHYPSGLFFIDGVCYNDLRSPKAIDYSEPIIKWAKEKGIGQFKTGSMENTTLDSLQPRLGYPYVYMHFGDCEHVISIVDVKLIQQTNCLDSSKYPRIANIVRQANIICYICSTNHATWICKDSDRLPHEKVFLCTTCCNSYNFIDGKKVGSFKLYPYYDHELLTRHLSNENDE